MDEEQQLENLERKYKVLQTKIDEINTLEKKNPSELRAKYDGYWNMIEDRESFINIDQEYINKNMDLLREKQESIKKNMDILEKQQELIDKINILYNEMKQKLSENKTGSLHGLMRETTKKDNILPNEYDVIAKNVLEQPYDEAERIARYRDYIGGKKRRIKNKTHKKRKNKNKKSRRFIRNK